MMKTRNFKGKMIWLTRLVAGLTGVPKYWSLYKHPAWVKIPLQTGPAMLSTEKMAVTRQKLRIIQQEIFLAPFTVNGNLSNSADCVDVSYLKSVTLERDLATI